MKPQEIQNGALILKDTTERRTFLYQEDKFKAKHPVTLRKADQSVYQCHVGSEVLVKYHCHSHIFLAHTMLSQIMLAHKKTKPVRPN